jgi:signal transduction histidine kinase
VALVFVLAAFSAVVTLVALGMRMRLGRARAAERLAVERRDRFLAVAASELDAPLAALRAAMPTEPPVTRERLAALARQVDELRAVVAELARPGRPRTAPLEPVDLGELVREIVEAPPFADRGPPVILRAAPVRVAADRGRLQGALRVLLWVVRRASDLHAPLYVTVASDEEHALVELDARGAAAAVEGLERLPAVGYGLAEPVGAPGDSLALRVAAQVAEIHGGQLHAAQRAGEGERFVLALPLCA